MNPLEDEKIEKLLVRFCIPALASNLVTSVYNIVDQLFIGNVLGVVGNAATNVIFPVVTLISALSLMCGVGSSNSMNMNRGNGNREMARRCVGGGLGLMVLCGVVIMVPMLLWTEPILYLFGCTETVLPYALPYARIISLSFVFSVIGAAGPFLIRADGSPNFSLACIAVGSLLNVALDALFILVFGWGIRGAAWATLIAQLVSTCMVLWYIKERFQSFDLTLQDMKPDIRMYGKMAAIGFGPAFNFATQALVQVFLNNGLRAYGARSVYGSDVCLAVVGVANKVNTLAVAMVVGLVLSLGLVIFFCYQLFPVQITSFFGDGDELYFTFAARFFRTFYLFTALAGLQSSVAGFFSAQGKVGKSVLISLVRQVIFFPPLLILLPRFMGLSGILWAGPISDLAMAIVAGTLFIKEIQALEAS